MMTSRRGRSPKSDLDHSNSSKANSVLGVPMDGRRGSLWSGTREVHDETPFCRKASDALPNRILGKRAFTLRLLSHWKNGGRGKD